MQTNNDLLNVTAAAAYLGISRTWLYQLPRKGGGPARTLIGRRVFFAKADLDTWRKERAAKVQARAKITAAKAARQEQRAAAIKAGAPVQHRRRKAPAKVAG